MAGYSGTKAESDIANIAIDFWVDGNSLAQGMALAQAEYNKALGVKYKMGEASATKMHKWLINKTKETNLILLREDKKFNKKREAQNRASLEKEARDRKTFAKGWQNFGGKIGTISSYGGAIAIINAVRQAFTFAIKTVIEFEVAFTDLAVKSGYTNKQMAEVSETIYSVAASTHFMTEEIVGAATTLAKLGFEAEEVVKILPHVGNVAAATGESLKATAEIFGKVLNAYEYTADQSGVIADRMVDVFNNSALSLEKFNTAFSYVGAAAASTGTSFNQLTAAMAVLSDRGVTASKIGTGLRNVFTKLGEEGDDLRDILERISEAHLSFYEVAELVGRRAANQLFIMADSLDEFDASVAASADDFGASMEAAAKQMDTFKSKWDILVNTIKNSVAGIEFDPDDSWKDSIAKSIDYLDLMNAMLSKENKNSLAARIISLSPEFVKSFKGIRDELGEGTNDWEIYGEMIRQAEDEMERLRKSGAGLGDLSEQARYIGSLKDIRKAMGGSGAMYEQLLVYDEKEAQSIEQKAVIEYDRLVGRVLQKIATKKKRDKFFQDFIMGGDKAAAEQQIRDMMKDGILSQDTFIELFENQDKITEDLIAKHKPHGASGSYGEVVKKNIEELQAWLVKNNQGWLTVKEGTDADDVIRIEKKIKDLEAWGKKMCSINKIEAAKYGFDCKDKKGTKDTTHVPRFKVDPDYAEEFKNTIDLLNKKYNAEKDPVEKAILNAKLIEEEGKYKVELLKQHEQYLIDMEALGEKHPTIKDKIGRAVETSRGTYASKEGQSERRLNTYNTRGNELTLKFYKSEKEAYAKYRKEIADLDERYRHPSTNTISEQESILKQRNKISSDYWNGELENAKAYYDGMEEQIKKAKAAGMTTVTLEGETMSIDNAETFVKAGRNVSADTIKEKKSKGTKYRKDGDEFNLEDYSQVVLGYADQLYDIYQMIGDRKLELLRQQVDRELEIIGERFDREADIRNSALASGIISQEAALEAEERANKKRIKAENVANKKLFDAEKKRDEQRTILDGIQKAAQAFMQNLAQYAAPTGAILGGISSALVLAQTGIALSGIRKRKFVPQKYAEGGYVEGRSHEQGGVPFTVAGRGGYEMEGGEFVVNKEATKKHFNELQRINNKTKRSNRHFATGGYVNQDLSAEKELLSSIAEALSQPVRAFVTDQDLAQSQSEREALTKKVSY